LRAVLPTSPARRLPRGFADSERPASFRRGEPARGSELLRL